MRRVWVFLGKLLRNSIGDIQTPVEVTFSRVFSPHKRLEISFETKNFFLYSNDSFQCSINVTKL